MARYMPQFTRPANAYGTGISFDDIRGMLWRQRRILFLVTLVALLAGVGVTMLMTQRYEAQATVRIDNESLNIVEGQTVDPVVNLSDTNRYLNTQKRVVESRGMAQAVVRSLRLDRNDAFLRAMGEDAIDTDVPASRRPALRQARVIDLLQDNVRMDIPNDNRIAAIVFQSQDAGLAAQVANAYADNYLQSNISRSYEANAYARRVLRSQVEQAQVQLRQSEMQANNYARANRLIDTSKASSSSEGGESSATATGSLTTANLVQVNSAYIEARNARILAEQRWKTAQNTDPRNLAEARNNSAIQQLTAERATRSAELAKLGERYLANHPLVLQAKAELAEVERKLNEAAGSIRASLKNEYDVALRQETELRAVREGLADDTLEEQDSRVQFNLISRDAQLQRDQLEELQRRLNQLDAASDISANNITLLDRAVRPDRPVSPSLPRNLMIALVLGLALAGLLAITRETLDDTLHSPEDAERKLGLPLLGTTPAVKRDEASHPGEGHGELSEAYFSIRAAIDFASAAQSHKVFLITSSQSGEGKSTTSIALARDFARIGRRVLLVDADLRKPSLHRQVGAANRAGFLDVLTRKAEIEQVLLPSDMEGLHLLGLGPVPANPVQLLSSDLLRQFVEKARAKYDVVILDSAPVMGLADAPILAQMADFTVLMVEAGRAHYGQAKSAIRRLTDSGANLLGIVITKFDHRDAGYGYDYLYSYYRDDDGEKRGKRTFAERVFGSE